MWRIDFQCVCVCVCVCVFVHARVQCMQCAHCVRCVCVCECVLCVSVCVFVCVGVCVGVWLCTETFHTKSSVKFLVSIIRTSNLLYHTHFLYIVKNIKLHLLISSQYSESIM